MEIYQTCPKKEEGVWTTINEYKFFIAEGEKASVMLNRAHTQDRMPTKIISNFSYRIYKQD